MKLNRQSFPPRLTLGMLVILVAFGCGKGLESKNTGGIDPGGNLSMPIDASLMAQYTCSDLTATVVVDGGVSKALTVNCGAGTISGSVGGLSPGTHSFTINYYVSGFFIASTTTTAVIVAGATTTVNFASAPITYSHGVALFSDTSYVDYILGDPFSEASSVEGSLNDKGFTVDTFTGITAAEIAAAVNGRAVLVIPELNADLNAAMGLADRTEIFDFVDSGGTLLVFPSNVNDFMVDLLNATFPVTFPVPLVEINDLAPINLDAASLGMRFEAGPATLPSSGSTYAITAATLATVTGGRSIYTDANGNSVVAWIPVGSGSIVVLGWDWFNAQPLGANDGGWLDVLATAVNLSRPLPDIQLVEASPNQSDVLAKLHRTGQFNSITAYDASSGTGSTPSVSNLKRFDSVLVFSNCPFLDPVGLGDNLADYVDGGAGAVLSMFAFNCTPPAGRFEGGAMDYYAIPSNSGQNSATPETLGAVFDLLHPIMQGVTSFNGGTSSYRPNTFSIVAGTNRIADWSDGTPLVVTRTDKVGRRADLGFYPASSDVSAQFWDTSTHGDKLMANALTWTADYPGAYRSTDAFPLAIPANDPMGVDSTITVAGAPTSLSKVTVKVNVSHTWDANLTLELISPLGTTITLTSANGGGADNYTNTTFTDAALTAIVAGAAPFPGSYTPDSPLGALVGEDANGTWTLRAIDVVVSDTGAINDWRLTIR